MKKLLCRIDYKTNSTVRVDGGSDQTSILGWCYENRLSNGSTMHPWISEDGWHIDPSTDAILRGFRILSVKLPLLC